jgi:hypothetical protein
MRVNRVIAAQLSTVHSSPEALRIESVLRHLEAVIRQVPIDILVVGWEEKPALFEALTAGNTRVSKETFLWYPFLSDYPGFDPAHLVVGIDQSTSRGWDGYDGTGINETFKQACPNNPEAVSTSMTHLRRLLTSYDFDGVFVDKIRFPSMANGLTDVLSCFCIHCQKKAAEYGLDLAEVKAALTDIAGIGREKAADPMPPGGGWLEQLLRDRPILQRFVRFRADSINRVVAEISDAVNRIGRKMSLDLFSPGLALLVGQDITCLRDRVDWVKPMIYRFGSGPSSLLSEIPALIHGLGRFLQINETEVMAWAASHVSGLQGTSLAQIESAVPLALLRAETRKAVDLFAETPVYLGLETVSVPGLPKPQTEYIREMVEIGAEAGVRGYTLSWDLLHTPVENVMPLKGMV